MSDAVVIGAGIAGLTAALRLAQGGARVTLVAGGLGGLPLSQGSIDIMGYAPDVVSRPLDAIAERAEASPDHPYARLGAPAVRDAVTWFADALPEGWLVGDPERNMRLPTAVGVARPTALAPPSLAAGDLRPGHAFAVVGLRVVKDFHPGIVAHNITRAALEGGGQVTAREAWIDMAFRSGEADSSPVTVARALDDPATRRRFSAALLTAAGDADVIAVPAVLGLNDPTAWQDICSRIGRPVAEIPTPPPCVPGMRLATVLTDLVRQSGVRVIVGGWVVDHGVSDGRVAWVATNAAGRDRRYPARAIVLAPGGFESGALHVDSYWHVTERVLGLPVVAPPEDVPILDRTAGPDQPLFLSGLAVDDDMRVVHPGGTEPVYPNVHAVGGILAGAIRWAEKSGEGIAIASAVRAADAILKEL